MKASDLPTIKLPLPFASSAVAPYVHDIPVTSQIGITDGAASLETGFVPDNFIAEGAGGIPPFGADFNGILKEISAWTRWLNAGGAFFPYDSAFAVDISGYPKGAICSGTAGGTTFYLSVVDDNLVDPTSAPGASWQVFGLGNSGATPGAYKQANITVGSDGRISAVTSGTLPTQTVLTAGSGTYTTPAGCRQLRIRMIGGGGGAAATTTNNGSQGGTTSFGAFTCVGGPGGLTTGAGGVGISTGSGVANFRIAGGDGSSGQSSAPGAAGPGGTGPFGGAGKGSIAGAAGSNAKTNTGAGGGAPLGVGSGAAGEYAEIIINSPAATYAYAVGAKGNGGAAGGLAGGDGGSGVIIIDELY